MFVDHAACGKVRLHGLSTCLTVKLSNFVDALGCVVNVATKESCQSGRDDLRGGSLCERDHRSAASKGLDHDETERLGPADRIDQRLGFPQQRALVCLGALSGVAELVVE